MQNASIQEKSLKNSYKYKEYTLPNGDIVKVQGYEPFALDILFKLGYEQEDVIISRSEVPEIWYNIGDDENYDYHRYFCDIYIKSINKIIEVKSEYTYNSSIEKNILKANACIDGYDFEFWIFTEDKSYKILTPDDFQITATPV